MFKTAIFFSDIIDNFDIIFTFISLIGLQQYQYFRVFFLLTTLIKRTSHSNESQLHLKSLHETIFFNSNMESSLISFLIIRFYLRRREWRLWFHLHIGNCKVEGKSIQKLNWEHHTADVINHMGGVRETYAMFPSIDQIRTTVLFALFNIMKLFTVWYHICFRIYIYIYPTLIL